MHSSCDTTSLERKLTSLAYRLNMRDDQEVHLAKSQVGLTGPQFYMLKALPVFLYGPTLE
jgi:hypothetical protein